nr:hypothetical protein [Clostridium botulinum]
MSFPIAFHSLSNSLADDIGFNMDFEPGYFSSYFFALICACVSNEWPSIPSALGVFVA